MSDRSMFQKYVAARLVSLAGAGLLATCSGCSIFGAIAYKLSPATKHPPLYKLAHEPTIVVVDRPVNFGEVSLDAQRICQSVTEALLAGPPGVDPKEAKPVAPILGAGLAIEARTHQAPDGRRLRPSEIGAACGAKQVIYVELGRYDSSISVGNDALDGHADAVIRVVDVATGEVRWPPEANQGYAVAANLPFTAIATDGSGQAVHNEQGLRDQMNTNLSEKISKIFTGWTEE